MDYRKQFYDLNQFIGGYFHQDWGIDYDWKGEEPDFETVVRFYKAKNPPATVARTTEQLQRFLALRLDDEQVEEVVGREFRSFYNPGPRGLTERQWLEEVLKILKEPTRAKTAVLAEQ